MRNIGVFFAYLTILMIVLQISRFFLRVYISNLKKKPEKKLNPKGNLMKFYRFILKNHRNFGIAGLAFAIIHFIIMWSYLWLSYTGLIALIVLMNVAFFGFLTTKNKSNNVKNIHKVSVVVLLLAMALHYFTNQI